MRLIESDIEIVVRPFGLSDEFAKHPTNHDLHVSYFLQGGKQ
jgi:hypothetical protein